MGTVNGGGGGQRETLPAIYAPVNDLFLPCADFTF